MSAPANHQTNEWQKFCADPITLINLENEAHSFAETISGFTIPHLHQGKNKLGRRSEPGSPVVWFKSGYTPQGVPFVNLTFSTFKNGGVTEAFDSKEALRALYEGHKSSQPAKAQKLRATQIAKKEKSDKDQAKFAAECLARDLALWNSLPTEGTSAYLDRKTVGDVARGLDCIRYGDGFILVRITDAAGDLRGFQRINDDGSKCFTAGLKKKSSFVILGGSLAQSGPIYIVEGLATGLSIRKAIGASVICALDAFNLEPVVKSLRKIKGLEIIIAADNDHTKAQKLNPQTGLPIGNTGLKKAHRAAIKYRCLVASPGFTPDDPGTDFNDLHQVHGLGAVRDDLDMMARPNPALAYQGEREKQIARKAKAFSRFELCRMESKYLPAETLRAAFERPDVKTIVAASPIGSGKTEAVAQLLNGMDPNERVLYISHLVSLNADAAARLGLEMYSDYKGHRSDDDCKLTELPRVAVCLNSLPMLIDGGHVQPFEAVVIDEIEQLIRRLTTPIEQKRLVIDVLKYLVQHAKKLILLDAHIGKVTLELLDLWRPDGGVILWNTYQPATNRTVQLYPDKETLISTAVEALVTGEKVFFCANSKKEARRVFKLIQTRTDCTGLYISGDNRGDAEVQAFFADVNGQSQTYDFIVASPAVCTGLNIDGGHFTWVGGAFQSDINTPADCVQALGRVRGIGTLHVWADGKRAEIQSTDPDEIAARWIETRKSDREFLGLNNDGVMGLTDMDYAAIVRTVRVSEGFQKNNFFEMLLKLLNDDGFRFEWQKSAKETAKELYREGKELEQAEYLQMRVDAPDLTPDEVDEIHNQTHHTLEQTVALDRYDLKEFYVIDESEIPVFVEFDRRGKGRAEVRNLEIALADGAELQRLTTLESTKLVPDQQSFFVLQSLLSVVLAAVGVNCRSFTMDPDARYSTDSLKRFVEWVEANRHILRGVMRIPPPEILASQPVRFISVVLRKIGLKQHRVGRNEKGQYCLDQAQLEKMGTVLERRGTLPIQVIQVSGDTSRLYIHEDSECPRGNK
jgi:phage/plasmid primase-like uncharacterized protein